MRSLIWFRSLSLIVALLLLQSGLGRATACPFCTPQQPYSEKIDESPASLAVVWVDAQEPDAQGTSAGSTTLRVVGVLKDRKGLPAIGETITLPTYHQGHAGQYKLLIGQRGAEGELTWGTPLLISRRLLVYLEHRPPLDLPRSQRLRFYIPFLEDQDEDIAVDAYSEFSNATYEEVAPLARLISSDRLTDWIINPDPATGCIARRGFYGMMLGLRGDHHDAQRLKQYITDPNAEGVRIGIDGIIGGYLFLEGESGLDVLDEWLPKLDKSRDSDAFAMQNSLDFMWTECAGRIPKERLRQSMRQYLELPGLASLAITSLTRWDDLTISNRLLELYETEGDTDILLRKAVMQYFITIASLDPAEYPEQDLPAINAAANHREKLRLDDPELYEKAAGSGYAFPR